MHGSTSGVAAPSRASTGLPFTRFWTTSIGDPSLLRCLRPSMGYRTIVRTAIAVRLMVLYSMGGRDVLSIQLPSGICLEAAACARAAVM